MKKIFLSFLLLFLLTSCFWKKVEEKSNTWVVNTWNTQEAETKKVTYEWVSIDVSEENLEKQRAEITLDDVELINFSDKKEEKNALLTAWKKFIDNLEKTKELSITKNINWGISFDNLEKETAKLPNELKKKVDMVIKVYDYETKKLLDKWTIFVNWVKLWDFEKWNFNKEFSWMKWIESFSIMARVPWYGDGFIKLNSIGNEWTFLTWDVFLKKLNSNKKVKLEKEVVVEDKTMSIKIPECSLVDSKWECFKGEVETKINFISADDVNNWNVSLNMKAVTKEGNIVDLQSGWMAFSDFITSDWEILQVGKWKTIEITYKVDEKTILDMENELYGQWQKNGYWLYDKNKNIWLEKEAEIRLDKENKTWTAIVSEIY